MTDADLATIRKANDLQKRATLSMGPRRVPSLAEMAAVEHVDLLLVEVERLRRLALDVAQGLEQDAASAEDAGGLHGAMMVWVEKLRDHAS